MLEHEIWLLWAENDLKVAKIVFFSNDVIVTAVLYHCQQCVEKALKAYLLYKKQAILKTHDLTKLLELCMQFSPAFSQLQVITSDLDPHVTMSRYPDTAFMMPDLTTTKILLQQTIEAFNFIRFKIEQKD